MKDSMKSEARQLPFVLGKVAGGLMCVAGFGGLVFILTRPPEPSTVAKISFAAAGIIGLALFIFCSKMMAARAAIDAQGKAAGKTLTSRALPWIILIVLAALFIVVILLISP